jgi:hypothetical protein
VHNIPPSFSSPSDQVVSSPFSVVETRVSVFLVIVHREQNGQLARDMRALLGENEFRQVNMNSFVIVLCFDSSEPGEVRV